MSDAADQELTERARKLFAGPIEFLKSAPDLKFLPDPVVPEIAFAGRSNVGKSSLLNALTNRKAWRGHRTRPGERRSSISSTSANRFSSGWSTCPVMALPKRRKTW